MLTLRTKSCHNMLRFVPVHLLIKTCPAVYVVSGLDCPWGEKWLPSFKFTFCSCFSTGLRPPNFPFRSRPPFPLHGTSPGTPSPPPHLFFCLHSTYTRPPYPGATPSSPQGHHFTICAHSRCLRPFANPYITSLPARILIACAHTRHLPTNHRGISLPGVI